MFLQLIVLIYSVKHITYPDYPQKQNEINAPVEDVARDLST